MATWANAANATESCIALSNGWSNLSKQGLDELTMYAMDNKAEGMQKGRCDPMLKYDGKVCEALSGRVKEAQENARLGEPFRKELRNIKYQIKVVGCGLTVDERATRAAKQEEKTRIEKSRLFKKKSTELKLALASIKSEPFTCKKASSEAAGKWNAYSGRT